MKTVKILVPVLALFISTAVTAQNGNGKRNNPVQTNTRVKTTTTVERREEARITGAENARANANPNALRNANENSALKATSPYAKKKYKYSNSSQVKRKNRRHN